MFSKDSTFRWQLPFLAQNQAHKEFTLNQAIAKIDNMLGAHVISRVQHKAPVDPKDGDMYIAPQSELDAWQQFLPTVCVNDLILYQGNWQNIKPQIGMLAWLSAEDCLVVFSKDSWRVIGKAL